MLKKIQQVVGYGYHRLRTQELQDEYINWLCFANAGMLNKGNAYLMDLAIAQLPTQNPIIEIGSFCGLSTNVISYLLKKHNKKNTIFCSDKWIFEGSDNQNVGNSDISHEKYRHFVKESFMRNVQMFAHDTLPYAIEEFSDDFFALWKQKTALKEVFGREVTLGGAISFAYIDGNHTYDFAKRDFENVDAHLDKGGFILFDDSADYYDFGSAKLMKEIKRNPNYEFIKKNPNYLFRKIV
ncbi:MAG: class I SAM-dependent methyltransferase [Cytophagales bacterium]|nr:MAG: class I SAM-dependent methyltransferase [Cytophagales bacterium]